MSARLSIALDPKDPSKLCFWNDGLLVMRLDHKSAAKMLEIANRLHERQEQHAAGARIQLPVKPRLIS